MALNKDYIGRKSSDRFVDIEAGQLRLFAKATGEKNPIYRDAEAAKAAGHRNIPAPPTFAFSLSLMAPDTEISTEDMGIDIARGLHGEQHFTYHAPLYAGDRVRLQTTVKDMFEKKGGALEFIVSETEAFNQNNELCVTQTTIVVGRNA